MVTGGLAHVAGTAEGALSRFGGLVGVEGGMAREDADGDTPIASDPGRIAAVESLIGLAHSQIAAGLSRAANIDIQALGLIGLDAGLIAVLVAAQGALGPHYWVAIPGLAISIVLGGSVLAVTRFDLGPDPEWLYGQVEAGVNNSGEHVTTKLLADLVDTDKTNKGPLRSKTMLLVIAVSVLALTILYTALLVVL